MSLYAVGRHVKENNRLMAIGMEGRPEESDGA